MAIDSPIEPERKGVVAAAEQGVVTVDGPLGIALSLTPEAAQSSARSLSEAAEAAHAQRMRS
jgi:hypothetical protein